ncbi:FLYWCH-type domain-containing protein, partial [Aphis craccivora]
MTCLKEIMPPDAEDLLTYFDSYYVNGYYRLVGSASTLHFRKIPPIFSPSSWNVHNATLVGEHRTNNMTEGWNNRFSKLYEAKLALDAVGDSKTVKKLGQTRTVEKRQQNLCIQIQAGNIGVLDFLTA